LTRDEYEAITKGITNEEVFHLYTHALARLFPTAVGDRDFTTSVSCREMAKLTCLQPGWHH